MKNTVKNILITILILYTISSITYLMYSYLSSKEKQEILREEIDFLNLPKISVQSEVYKTIYDSNIDHIFYQMYFIDGKLEVTEGLIVCLIFSAILGTVIGATISLKENSKAKYILYFIFGNIFFNTISTLISQSIYWKNNYDRISLQENYIECFKTTFIGYVIFYIIFTIIRILINKFKVDKLNTELLKRGDINGENK